MTMSHYNNDHGLKRDKERYQSEYKKLRFYLIQILTNDNIDSLNTQLSLIDSTQEPSI